MLDILYCQAYNSWQQMNGTTVFTLKNVPTELANAFRAACHLDGKRYREVLLECMTGYVKKAEERIKKEGIAALKLSV
jgi:hypothetical protein